MDIEDLSPEQNEIIKAEGHVLVIGGPGSGKTTVSIIKSSILAKDLIHDQKVLFLSFARATVSRVIEAIDEQGLDKEVRRRILVDTYHSFFWRLIQTHGYLLGLPRKLTVLTPSDQAAKLAHIRVQFDKESKLTEDEKKAKKELEITETNRLAFEDGAICFDLFAEFCVELLSRSVKIRTLISQMYPVVILDEFQDTDLSQWQAVIELGKNSTLIALADPEQRIYDFKGADPKRLSDFVEHFQPREFDLKSQNYRSSGTDIAMFGNDLLSGIFQQKRYKGISREGYAPNAGQAHTKLVTSIYSARDRVKNLKDWSVAVLVPTKKLTRQVSEVLSSPPAGMQSVSHTAALEIEPIILASECVGYLLSQPCQKLGLSQMIHLLQSFYRGKGGDKPSATSLKTVASLGNAILKFDDSINKGKAPSATGLATKISNVMHEISTLKLSGNPEQDWKTVREKLEQGDSKQLQEIASEVRNLRLLKRGLSLRASLAENWHEHGTYKNTLDVVKLSFANEYFSRTTRPETGVIVLNMHKAKGKQFDEVIIFEGWPVVKRGEVISNSGRIVGWNDKKNANSQARQNFRVSVTRAKRQTTILTPLGDPCVLLV